MPFALELLAQIDRNTVDFDRNFDDTMDEPVVLPAAVPNLLVNGASGIAVGMATNIPPHNLGEVIDALTFMLKEWEKLDDIAIPDLMQFIKGPDFPTGGIILQENGNNEIQTAYATGRGRVSVRGRVHAEEMGRGRNRLIITELPYMTNKASLVERIAELVREGGLEGIVDLRDESDRQGMRIVIELSKSADTDKVLLDLYKRTPLQSTFGIALLALVDGEPRLLSLKQALKVYLEHRLEVVRRRSEFDLAKAQQRAHILEGLRVAIKNLDEIINMIRNAPDVETARSRLMRRFKLTEIQAQAILDMQLRRIAALERKKIEEEYKELLKTIKDLEALLKSPRRMREMVGAELLQVRQMYNDNRRTHILELKEGESAAALLTSSELTPAKEVWAVILPDGTAARTSNDKLPRVSGRQAAGWLLKTDTHHTLYIANEEGKAAAISVEALPISDDLSAAVPTWKISPLGERDELAAVFSVPPRVGDLERFIVTATRLGMVKKTAVQELPGPSAQLFTLAKVNGGDALAWAGITDGEAEIFMATEGGMAIRFAESEVRPMGLVAAGVNGIKLKAGDAVAGVERLSPGDEILIVASNGRGWRTSVEEFPLQGRYGQGVIACKLPRGARCIGILVGKRTQMGIAHYWQAAARLLRLDAVASGKRAGAGAEVLPVKANDSLVSVTPMLDGFEPWIEKKKSAPARKSRTAAKTR